MKLQELATQHKTIFWDTADVMKLSDSAIMERFLNYSDWDTFTSLFKLMSKSEFYTLFEQLTTKKRVNLRPEALNLAKVYAAQIYG